MLLRSCHRMLVFLLILKDIVKEEDIPFLAQSAYDDACRPGNPRETSVEEITELYKSLI